MTNKTIPNKADVALLPWFAGLELTQIHIPDTEAEFAQASAAIMVAGLVGFDTESKPTFKVGEVSEGPHVVQFALADRAYLFQVHKTAGWPFLLALLQAPQLSKVGFDLKSDTRQIQAKLGISIAGVIDLNQRFHQAGYAKDMGVRNAVALVLQQRFAKSRKISTSNWSQTQLSPQQQRYAANDAYAALQVWQHQFALTAD